MENNNNNNNTKKKEAEAKTWPTGKLFTLFYLRKLNIVFKFKYDPILINIRINTYKVLIFG